MIRILLGVLVFLVAALAYLMELPYLYPVAGVLAFALLMSWAIVARNQRLDKLRSQIPQLRVSDKPEEELTALGILEIRERGDSVEFGDSVQEHKSGDEEAPGAPESMAETSGTSTQTQAGNAPGTSGTSTQRQFTEFVRSDALRQSGQRPSSMPDPRSRAVLVPLLEGLRQALGAHSAGLARRYRDACEFRLLAAAGEHWAKSPGEVFRSGSTPLVRDSLSVSVRDVEEEDLPRRSLTYSSTPASIRQVAVAAVSDPPLLLFVDTTVMNGLSHERVPVLLAQFVRTLGLLLRDVETGSGDKRPRREIISEEMARARARDQQLALALVFLNRAEEIAGRSDAELEEADAVMSYSLQNASKSNRVIQFGPLTYGVFINGGIDDVEMWDRRVHNTFGRAEGLLEGGISVGVAMLHPRHESADEFRDEAKHALVEAYNSGTPSVLARVGQPG